MLFVYVILDVVNRNSSDAEFVSRHNIMPYVGVLTDREAGRTLSPVAFPSIGAQ